MTSLTGSRQTDMARSTRLVILIKNIYTLWGQKRFSVSYFPTNLVYPFTLRVAGITRKNAIVDYLDYQMPVTQLKGQNTEWTSSKARLNCATYP